jgi:ribose transport system ATP-binding protein
VASITLAVQLGTGDATAGQNYTLQSIAAVVLGGASIYGGRGSVLVRYSARCCWPRS